MANLNPLELGRLKSLLAGKPLTMGEKISTLDILRSRFSDLFSGLTEANLKDNNFLVKYLTNPYNRNKIKNALRSEESLTAAQLSELEESLAQKPAATEGVVYQQGQAPVEGVVPQGASGGGMPRLPSAPSFSSRPTRFIHNVPHAPEEPFTGPGEGTAATNKSFRINQAAANPGVKFRTGPANAFKTFTSNSGIFAKQNLGRIGSGLKNMFGNAANFGGRAGLGAINHGGNFLSNLSNSRLRLSGSLGKARSNVLSKGSGKKVALMFAGIFFLLFFMSAISGMTGTTPTGEAAPITPGSSDISQCKFTRAGSSQKIKSPTLLGWINAAAASAGIPAQVLASVAMHESQDFVASASDTKYVDEIKSNKYCNPGKLICINKENTGTLYPEDGNDHPCTADDTANKGARTAQAIGLMQNIDIYNPGKDLCSITENLAIAAAKLKADGITSQPTQAQVNTAINKYYNSCTYDSYSYCNEVWQDLQKCQAAAPGGILPPAAGLTGITTAAANIDSLLFQRNSSSSNLEDRLFHNKKDEFGVYYWCTYIVIDSYASAGFPGLTRAAHGGVLSMKSFFANTPGYQLLSPDTLVEQLRPGDVIFFEGSNDQHVSLVKAVGISQEGNGFIFTFEANNVVLQDAVTVQNHKAISAQTTANKFRITGFGQLKGQ